MKSFGPVGREFKFNFEGDEKSLKGFKQAYSVVLLYFERSLWSY